MRHRLIHVKPTGDGAFLAWEPGGTNRQRFVSLPAAIDAIERTVLGHARAHVVVHDATGAIVSELIVGPDRRRIVAA